MSQSAPHLKRHRYMSRWLRTRHGLSKRLQSLHELHASLEARIRKERLRPLPDGLVIQRLKRMRLKAKEEIASIAGVMRTLNKPKASLSL